MKIYDIISESHILNENITLFVNSLRQLIGRGAVAEVEGLLVQFTRMVAGRPTAARELGEAWAKLASETGMEAAEAIAMGRAAATAQRVAPEIIEAAEREAASLIRSLPGRSRWSQFWKKAKSAKEKAEVWYMGSFKTINAILYTWGILEPIYEAITHIGLAYEEADKGNPKYKDNLDYIVTWEITRCVQSVAAIWAGRKITAWVFEKGLPSLPFTGGPRIGKLWNGMSQPAQTAFLYYFQTKEGQEAFAQWMVGELLIPYTEWSAPGGGIFKDITRKLGGLAKSGYDAILRKAEHRYAGQVPDNPLDKPENKQAPIKFGKYDSMTGRAADAPY